MASNGNTQGSTTQQTDPWAGNMQQPAGFNQATYNAYASNPAFHQQMATALAQNTPAPAPAPAAASAAYPTYSNPNSLGQFYTPDVGWSNMSALAKLGNDELGNAIRGIANGTIAPSYSFTRNPGAGGDPQSNPSYRAPQQQPQPQQQYQQPQPQQQQAPNPNANPNAYYAQYQAPAAMQWLAAQAPAYSQNYGYGQMYNPYAAMQMPWQGGMQMPWNNPFLLYALRMYGMG